MTRLYDGTGDDGFHDHMTEREARRLAAGVPRLGRQRHPAVHGESTDPLILDDPDHVVGQLLNEWRTTA